MVNIDCNMCSEAFSLIKSLQTFKTTKLQNADKFSGNSCNEVRSITIAKDLGHVQHLSFNRTDKMISICVGNEVWIIVVEVPG